MSLVLALLLQIGFELPIPDLPEVGGEIVGPYIFREDAGQTTKTILKNGLTVIVREENAIPLTSITTHVKAGYFDEPDRVSGISHLIEHMFFKGTELRGVGEIAKETKTLGGTLNAYTHYDRTVYHAVVPSENTFGAMEIQADALWNPRFDSAELAREIEVVLQENNRKLDNPSAVAVERLYATAFEQHRMRRWRIGTPEGLRALTREDLMDYYRQHYQPSNIILSIVGQFDREELLDAVVRLYGSVVDEPADEESAPSEPPQNAFRYDWSQGPTEHAHVAMGYHVPGELSDDAPVMEVLSAILTSGRSSRFNRFLRDEQGLVSQASSEYLGFRDLGFFQLSLDTTDPVEAEIGALVELERIRRFGVTFEQLARARVLVAAQYYRRLETVGAIADELAIQEALGDWKRVNSFLSRVRDVSAADIERVVSTYLTTNNLSTFEYLPEGVSGALTSDRFSDDVLATLTVDMVERGVEELPVSAEVQLLDAELVTDLVEEPVRRAVLRGPDVYVVEDHRLPLVSFGIFYPGGRLYESAENAGITEFMLRSALRGTRRYNTADISRRLENAGARIEVVNEPDFFGYVLESVSGNVVEALDVLMDIVQEPTFLEDRVDGERALQEARVRKLREDNLRYAVQLFMETLFGSHSYALSGMGSLESVGGLSAEDLREWHRLHQRTLVPLIVIVGDTSGTGLVASIAETLTNEDLEERNISLLEPPESVLAGERVETARRRQSALIYGVAGPTGGSQDRFAMTAVQNALSGLGGRLFETIREQQGLAYTVRVSRSFLARSGTFFAYTAFSPENESQVRVALEAEIGRVREEGLTEEELQRAVNYSIAAHEVNLQTRRGRVLAIASAVIAGDGLSGVTEYSESMRRVSQAAVLAAARRYLDPSLIRVAVLRGQE